MATTGAAEIDNVLASPKILAAAKRQSRRLELLNRATLAVAIVVYSTIVIFCLINVFIPPIVFTSCVMLAEILVYQFVKTMLAHFAVVRDE